MEAFADPAIKGIISTIGGDDSIRLLPYLDLQVIRDNPKVFLGYSDTTVTHLACFKAGLVSFYGPSVMAGFAEHGGIFPYTAASVRQTLFLPSRLGCFPPIRMAGRPNYSIGATPPSKPNGVPYDQAQDGDSCKGRAASKAS